jgi:predicted permease
MSAFDGLRYRVRTLRRALLDRAGWRREMDEELGFHLSLEEMQQRHAGAAADDARRAARRRLGHPARVRERVVDDSGVSALDALAQDVRFAVRTLRAHRGFTAVAVLTLAVGIGANVAIFSAVHAMLLRQLPFAEPERLMKVSLTRPARGGEARDDDAPWSYPKFLAFRDAQRAFSHVALYGDNQFTLRGGDAERVDGEVADAAYLPTLGVQPALGRNFAPDEDRRGGARAVLLSDALWQRRFDADPSVVGRTVNLNRELFTVVGVMPPGFKGLTGRAELWVPIVSGIPEMLDQAWSHGFTVVARRRPGVPAAEARAQVAVLGTRVDRAYPHPDIRDEHWGATARELDATRVDPVLRRALLVMLGAVGLVLLIACANVANLLLVRAAGRQREIAVRVAIGAGRGRLVRQLLTESVLLAGAGGAAGLAIAWWGVRLLATLDPTRWTRLQRSAGLGAVSFESIRLDTTALGYATLVALVTGVAFGLVPALQATRPSLTGALRDGGVGAAGRGWRGFRGRNALAVGEIALALVLLAGSGLMLRSLGKLLRVSPGVDVAGTLTLRVGAPQGTSPDSLPGYYDRVLERVGALPGVTGVTMQDCPPLNGGCNGTALFRRDRPAQAPGTDPEVGVHWITPNWPAVMRVPLLRGRAFGESDRLGRQKVVLVSETAARRIWPGEDAVGKPVSVGQGGFHADTALVVGVVGDVRYGTLDSLPQADVYLSYAQSPRARTMLFVRTDGDAAALAPAVRRAVRELAPDSPVYEVRTLEERTRDAMSFSRFSALLLALFGGVALALATVGVYGVISFAVAQRTREIGVRVALGATRGDVVRMVVGRQGLSLAAAGAALGLAGALAATRVLQSLLYGVTPSDPATFVAIVAVLGAAVLAASWIPARRAAGVDPTVALREG